MERFFCLLTFLGYSLILSGQILISPPPSEIFLNETNNSGHKLGVVGGDIMQLKGDTLLMNYGYSPSYSIYPQNLDFWTQVLNENYFNLILIDENLKIIDKRKAIDLHKNGIKYQGILISEDHNNVDSVLICVGIGVNDTIQTDKPSWFIWTMDSDLNVLSEYWYKPILDYSVPIKIAGVLQNGNILVKSIRQTTASFKYDVVFQEITPKGELVNYKNYGEGWDENPIQHGGFKILNNNSIVAFKNKILDEKFNIKCSFSNDAIFTGASIEVLDSTRFLFAVANYGTIFPTNVHWNVDMLLMGDHNCNLDTVFINYVNPSPKENTQVKSYTISANDTSHIYYTTCTDGWYLYERNNVTIRCMDLSGNVHWAYYFGEDASYNPRNVLTTEDGGCTMFLSKAVEANNPSGWTTSVDVAQFDKDGNVLAVSTEGDYKLDLQQAQVYPNPFSDRLVVEVSPRIILPLIEVFDMLGNRVLKREGLPEKIDLDANNLQKGVYFYRIISHGDIVASGKLLKN